MAECTPGQHPYLFNGASGFVTFAQPADFESVAAAAVAANFPPPDFTISNVVFSPAGGVDWQGNPVPTYTFDLGYDDDVNEQVYLPDVVCTGGYVEPGGGEPFDGDLNWASAPHMLQAVMVLCLVFLFFHGYAAGRRP